jgi:hypothetical protein
MGYPSNLVLKKTRLYENLSNRSYFFTAMVAGVRPYKTYYKTEIIQIKERIKE